MCFKKFAMLTISCAVIYAFSGNTASASTADSITNNQTVVQQETDTVVDDGKDTVDDGSVTVATPTPLPKATQQPDNAKKATTKKKKKKTKKSSKKAAYTKSELRLMASIINCEAGGESYQGKLAVGIVIMNRVHSKKFPNTVKKVIYQKHQFSPVTNGSLKKKLRQYDRGKTKSSQWKSCISAAKKTLSGQKTIVYKGKVKNMKSYKFFSVRLRGARMRLGGHRFK